MFRSCFPIICLGFEVCNIINSITKSCIVDTMYNCTDCTTLTAADVIPLRSIKSTRSTQSKLFFFLFFHFTSLSLIVSIKYKQLFETASLCPSSQSPRNSPQLPKRRIRTLQTSQASSRKHPQNSIFPRAPKSPMVSRI